MASAAALAPAASTKDINGSQSYRDYMRRHDTASRQRAAGECETPSETEAFHSAARYRWMLRNKPDSAILIGRTYARCRDYTSLGPSRPSPTHAHRDVTPTISPLLNYMPAWTKSSFMAAGFLGSSKFPQFASAVLAEFIGQHAAISSSPHPCHTLSRTRRHATGVTWRATSVGPSKHEQQVATGHVGRKRRQKFQRMLSPA
ncbi:uncharacterized protein UV8b_05493 [Ustilaginoidea virens]|uniref:Uncharacterized protein n=1 Tax=Ustilaginoidea virens TaxID=1159556 RepID=A0A8E5HTB1_USTVR|nr:uncharacterized protein UV8b_05493 [Ustilaginoidea virens]QUC21250.1 hypothetical protein UV8b_05493 [Ustilaginoidea virens]